MKVEGVDDGFLMYENKNTQEICIIPVTMNERNKKIIDEAFDWMREVYAAYTNNTLPTRGFTKTQWACKNCPVKTKCWKEMEDGEITIKSMEAPK